jgi:hypothetical protein
MHLVESTTVSAESEKYAVVAAAEQIRFAWWRMRLVL